MQDQLTLVSKGSLTVLSLPASALLTVLRGAVWLTEEGVAQDFVLRSGACHYVRKGGRVLVDTASEALLQIHLPCAEQVVQQSEEQAC